MKHTHDRPRCARSLALLVLALAVPTALAQTALAQTEGAPAPGDLTPLGTPVELDETCVGAPAVFEGADGPIAIWHRLANPAGLFGRTGPSLDQLGPRRQINDDSAGGGIGVVPLADGFAAAWIRVPASQVPEVVFQRFGTDLLPAAAEVVVGPASLQGTPTLVAEPFGVVLIAYYGAAGTVQARRYSASDVPLTPAIDVDPAVSSNERRRIRVATGVNQFLVAWEGALPAQTPGLWVRALGFNGAPVAASVRVTSLAAADFDIAWAWDEYLAVVPDGNVWGYRIATNGTPTAPAGLLAPATSPQSVELTPDADVLWLSFIEPSTGLVVSRIELPSLTVLENPALLVPEIPKGQSYLVRGAVAPREDGLVAAWQTGINPPIPVPCAGAAEIFAQAFGPAPPPAPGGADVPVLPPAGLLALALLIAAGGLSLLRR